MKPRPQLPVKLHTGFYAGHSPMPLARLRLNAGSAAELCRQSPETKFVFMHLGYPYYEEFLALVKQWANAYIDLPRKHALLAQAPWAPSTP